jgi:transcriptional regulator with GAF, ATPase, and Fis domain
LFTPSARNIFNLILSDYGRPLSDITNKLNYTEYLHDAEIVLDKLTPLEHEVSTTDGKVFLIRTSPYRTTDDRINGVVITFVDVTERKEAQQATEENLKATQTLHNLSTKLISEENFQVLYDEVISAAINITKADAGTVQILDGETQELMLLSTRGFSKKTMEHFARVNAASNTSCGRALEKGDRAFIDFDDPDADDADGSLAMHVQEGYLSGQSTPLIARSGKTIGMISTHWKEHHHRSTERELRYLDLLARQAADIIEQLQITKELQRNMDELTRFNGAMVKRESRMIELKKEVNELCNRVGESPRYRVDPDNEANKS